MRGSSGEKNEDFYCKFIASSGSIRGSLRVSDKNAIDRVIVPARED